MDDIENSRTITFSHASMIQQRLDAARARIKARQPMTIVCDTPELVAMHGMQKIGDAVFVYPPAVFHAGSQDSLDDWIVENLLDG